MHLGMFRQSIYLLMVMCIMSIAFVILNIIVVNKIVSNHLFYMWDLIGLSSFTSQSSYAEHVTCSANDILVQANKFQQLFSQDKFWSACYKNDYLTMLYLADLNKPRQQKKLLFDIGANKGYNIAAWLSMWKPEMGINSKTLHEFLSQLLNANHCGVCSDCNETTPSNIQTSSYLDTTFEIHAFEPIESTYKVLRQIRTWMNISTLYIHQLAITNTTGIANMRKCPVGGESCGLMNEDDPVSENEKVFQTQTMTLDDFVKQKKIRTKIDLLKIDTEGADPLVLQGAKKLFSKEQVRMLIFENHEIGAWKTTRLLTVIETLNMQGFTCYMLGKTGLVLLTNCWSSALDVKQWSNVLCIHRREKHLLRLLDALLITSI
ncbi:hypothetical protein I4U23_012356 [Adineta vaga]|nr:hypothetical protein I4U23_012356 [Adineta vaga]